MPLAPDGMRITARVYGPRPLTTEEQLATFMTRADDMLWEQARTSITAWRGMAARTHKRSGTYAASIDVVNINPAPRSLGIEIGSTLSYAGLLEEGRGPVEARGRGLGNYRDPKSFRGGWPDKKGLTQAHNTAVARGPRKDKGLVFRKSVGPAEGAHFVPRVMHFTEPALRTRVAESGRKIRDAIIAEMNAKGELTV